MKSEKNNRILTILTLTLLCLWFVWDFSQAKKEAVNVYQTWKKVSDFDAISSATTKVSIIRSDDDSLSNPVSVNDAGITYQQIEAMVRRAIDLAGGIHWLIHSGDMVLLKPNIVDAIVSGNGAITDVRVVKALIKVINEIDPGNIEIVVGEGTTKPMDYEMKYAPNRKNPYWEKLWDVAGYQDLLTDTALTGVNLRLSNLNGSPEEDMWQDLVHSDVPNGGVAQPQQGKYWIHKDVVNADVFISVPVAKVHSTGITVGLKNCIGLAASSKYGYWKTNGVPQNYYQTRLVHDEWTDEEIVDLSMLGGINYVVVDAIACLESSKSEKWNNGVVTNLKRLNCILTGADPVAVDHVCARIMGMNPDDINHITLAGRLGMGTNQADDIEIKGATVEETMQKFKKDGDSEGDFGQSNREWILNGPHSITDINNPMDHEFISSESTIAPAQGENGWSDAIYFFDDRLDLDDYFNYPDDVVVYAFTYFNALQDQSAKLWIGSDEALKIYLNGEVVYNYSGTRSFKGLVSDKNTSLNIKAGGNTLLVKAIQKTGQFKFSLNICEIESNSNYDGNRVWGLKFHTDASQFTTVTETNNRVHHFNLSHNYPNPFNSQTIIKYQVAEPCHVILKVYDVSGREIKTLVDAKSQQGQYKAIFKAESLPSGIYYYQIRMNDVVESRKMAYVK